MKSPDNYLILFAAIIIGVAAQQVLAWLKQHGKKTPFTILRPVVLLYWIGLSLAMIIGGVMQLRPDNLLPGIGTIALGVGLMLSGLGQALGQGWLKIIGVVVLATGPIVSGVSFIQSGNALGGMIALALGLGILVSALKGWPGGIGQTVIGAVIFGSSAMLLISSLVMNTMQTDLGNVAIGVAMFVLGLLAIISGAITVIGSIRKPAQSTPPSVS